MAGPVDRFLYASLAPARIATVLLDGFAAITLLLDLVGVYGVLSYAVNRATLENPQPVRTPQTVPGSKLAAFWRIFVPGSSLPLREMPTSFPTILIPPGETSPQEPTVTVLPFAKFRGVVSSESIPRKPAGSTM